MGDGKERKLQPADTIQDILTRRIGSINASSV